MLDSSSKMPRSNSGRRATALYGVLALALLQVSLATHQFQHISDHGLSICQVCTVLNQLDDVPVSGIQSFELPVTAYVAIEAQAATSTTRIVSPYRSRAPPNS